MAEDFATALTVLPKYNHNITSCVDTVTSQAMGFAERYKVPNIFTNFEDMARCPEVDAVYISPPLNAMHSELCHMMLNHDKHVLCEQPLCMAEKEVVELATKARQRGLLLMEGIWPRFIPAYHLLQREIMFNKLGSIYQVECQLGWRLPITQETPYCGVTKGLAPYGLQFILWVYREVPQSLRVVGKRNIDGIDVATNVEFIFNGNRTALMKLTAEMDVLNVATIRGTKGSVTLDNAWCPGFMAFENKDVEFVLPKAKQSTYYNNRVGVCYEVHEMRKCILNGCTESDFFSHDESQLMAHLMQQIQEMAGVAYVEQEQKLIQANN